MMKKGEISFLSNLAILNKMKLTFKLTESKNGNLSKDIEKMIKKDTAKKNKKTETIEFKGKSNF